MMKELPRTSPVSAAVSAVAGWTLLVSVLLGTLMLGGCEEDAGPLPENLPPETYLTIQGASLDTVNYRQILRWWGSDTDGRVVGYCIRWDGGWEPRVPLEPCEFDDGTFYFTTATVDTFIVPTEGTFAERTFEVRAMDDEGLVDPTGRSQVFRLENWAPELYWSQIVALPTISLPAVSFAFTSDDLDGRNTVASYRVWLDGEDEEADGRAVTDTLFAFDVEDFGDSYGERTIFVRAFDEARTPSNVIEHTWTVEAPPEERYLLIDNVSSDTPGESTEDNYFRAIFDGFAPDDYFVYDIEERGDFRSPAEIRPLFDIFDGVVWYGGVRNLTNDTSCFFNMGMAEEAITGYLEDGGNMVLVYRDAVGDSAALPPDFAEKIAGIEGFFREIGTGEHNIRLRPGADVETPLDTTPLVISGSTSTSDFMQVAEDIDILFSVAPGFLDPERYEPEQTTPAALGLQSRRASGKLAIIAFNLARSERNGNHLSVGEALLERILP